MAIANLPAEHKESLLNLVHMEDSVFHEILSRLQASKPSARISKLADSLGDLATISRESLSGILRTVSSLLAFADRREIASSEVAEDVCKRIDEGGLQDFRWQEQKQRHTFKTRLLSLLNSDSLSLTVRAREIIAASEHTFAWARVITNVRPLYSGDVKKPLRGAAVVHSLVIHYHEGDQHKEIHLALDDEDLFMLRKVIERAGNESTELRSALSQSNIVVLE
jgi:hypothetical protein